MIKNVGVVSEGPTDYVVIKKIIASLSETEDLQFTRLWPEDDCRGRSTGWRGVWDFCTTELKGNVERYMKDISPKLDLLVIHMDCDVTNEHELYCPSQQMLCEMRSGITPLNCEKSKKGQCPKPKSLLPTIPIDARVQFLRNKVNEWLESSSNNGAIICLPCDSIEAWIVTAFEGDRYHNPPERPMEAVEHPADTIIALSAYYCDIKVERAGGRLRKRVPTYQNSFAPKVMENWDLVKSICIQAKIFEEELRAVME